jgi:hypothetical protein
MQKLRYHFTLRSFVYYALSPTLKDRMGEVCNTCEVNARNLDNASEHNIKMNFNDMRYGIVYCIQFPQGSIKWLDVLKIVRYIEAHNSRKFNY